MESGLLQGGVRAANCSCKECDPVVWHCLQPCDNFSLAWQRSPPHNAGVQHVQAGLLRVRSGVPVQAHSAGRPCAQPRRGGCSQAPRIQSRRPGCQRRRQRQRQVCPLISNPRYASMALEQEQLRFYQQSVVVADASNLSPEGDVVSMHFLLIGDMPKYVQVLPV